MSDRMFAQTCPQCSGICPAHAQVCRYCKSSLPRAKRYSFEMPVAKKGALRSAAILLAILMVLVLIVINILAK